MCDRAQHVLPNDTGVVLLECKAAFDCLSKKEKLYAHYISQAAWNGGLAVLLQTSPESPGIFILLQKLFKAQPVDDLKKAALEKGVTEDDFQAFFVYAAGFYSNAGNYKSFGDTKFIPNLSKEKFYSVLECSSAYTSDPKAINALWERVGDAIFSLNKKNQQLGLGDKGITTYFSANCDISDAELAQKFLDEKKISAYNTRLMKVQDGSSGDGKTSYTVKLASSATTAEPVSGIEDDAKDLLGEHQFTPEGATDAVTFQVTRGDYSKLLERTCENLRKAKEYAANDLEVEMLEKYACSFSTGSINAHKEGSKSWIKNKGPVVESYIGFIESYRDPYGVRGEFEGFVAMVNKQMSAKFGSLVENAEHLLPLLPWPASYEKDTFLRPDFTSLDVLMFGGSGIPAGINIPNYDDIRQTVGFKNVSLGNVLSSGYKDTKITFLKEEDKEVYTKMKVPSFEVQVGLHELLGHGSGKLFIKNADGSFNFDDDHVTHTETGEKISSWYGPNETYDSKFAVISSSYEECRAECVGLYLCLSSEVLRIFGHEGDQADNIIYINWLNMVRAGLLGLEFYCPETHRWRQAHMQARYVILNVLLEAGEDFVKVERITGEDGEDDLVITLDRTLINTVGKKAIGDFLRKLQVYKATGDFTAAKEMYLHYSSVSDEREPHFLSARTIVLARKQPRKMFVQCNTTISGEEVVLHEYESSAAGLIQSMVERFPSSEVEDILQELWDADHKYFPSS